MLMNRRTRNCAGQTWSRETLRTGVYILALNDLHSIPCPKMIFFLLSRHVIFWLKSCPFSLSLPYFAFFSSFYFPFSRFLFPVFLLFSPLFLFIIHFSPFSLPLFIFFPQWQRLIFPPGGGEVYSWRRMNSLDEPCSRGADFPRISRSVSIIKDVYRHSIKGVKYVCGRRGEGICLQFCRIKVIGRFTM